MTGGTLKIGKWFKTSATQVQVHRGNSGMNKLGIYPLTADPISPVRPRGPGGPTGPGIPFIPSLPCTPEEPAGPYNENISTT